MENLPVVLPKPVSFQIATIRPPGKFDWKAWSIDPAEQWVFDVPNGPSARADAGA